jgi:hypothetical protein
MRVLTAVLSLGLLAPVACSASGSREEASDEQALSWTTTLAYGQHRPIAIAVDDSHVYWATYDPTGDEAPFDRRYDVLRVAKSGGTVERVASSRPLLVEFAIDASHVYWLEQSKSCETNDGSVLRVPKSGGAVEMLAKGLPCGIVSANSQMVVDDSNVYFTGDGGVHVLPKTGGAPVLFAVAGPTPHASRTSTVLLRADATTLFWGDSYGPLWAQAKDGESTVKLLERSPWVAALDATHLYFVRDRMAWRVAKHGGAIEQLGPADVDNASAVAVDDVHVYWSSTTERTIRRIPKTGAPSSERFAVGETARALALDDTSVFFPHYGTEYVAWMAPRYVAKSGAIRRRTKE